VRPPTTPPREISEKEAAFNSQIAEASRAGSSVSDIVREFQCQSVIDARILRATGLPPPDPPTRRR